MVGLLVSYFSCGICNRVYVMFRHYVGYSQFKLDICLSYLPGHKVALAYSLLSKMKWEYPIEKPSVRQLSCVLIEK